MSSFLFPFDFAASRPFSAKRHEGHFFLVENIHIVARRFRLFMTKLNSPEYIAMTLLLKHCYTQQVNVKKKETV